MEPKLLVLVVFIWAGCHVTEAQLIVPTTLGTNITSTTCGSSKLCVFSVSNCNPSGNSSCFFSSIQVNNQTATIELTGTTSGYVALVLIANQSQGGAVVFVCGNNNTNTANNTVFFQTATLNGTNITPANVSSVTSVQGALQQNQSLIQCTFNITTNLIISAANNFTISNTTSAYIAILNGSTNGTQLGNGAAVINTSTPINLTNSSVIVSSSSANTNNNTVIVSNSTANPTNSANTTNSSTANTTNSSANTTNSSANTTNSSANTTNSSANTTNSTANTTNNSTVNTTNSTANPSNNSTVNTTNSTANPSNNNTANPSNNNTSNPSNNNTANPSNNNTANPSNNNTANPSNNNTANPSNNNTANPSNNNTANPSNNNTANPSNNNTANPSNNNTANPSNNNTVNPTTSTVNTTNNSTVNPTTSTNVPQLNITSNGCGSTKLCLLSRTDCNGGSTCFFTSSKLNNQTFSFELSGPSSGYVALALANQNSSYVFVCGNNNTNNGSSFFFQTDTQNGSVLTPANVTTVSGVLGTVSQNPSLIQCIFSTSTSFNLKTAANVNSYNISILTGSTNGTQLGNAATQVATGTPVDLSNPSALSNGTKSVVSQWTLVLALLLSAMSLHFVTSHSP